MNGVNDAILDSWSRQARIIAALMTRVSEANRKARPSDDGLPLDAQLAHIHNTRGWFLSQINPAQAERLKRFDGVEFDGTSSVTAPLEDIKVQVELSSLVVGEVLADWLADAGGRIAPYDKAMHFFSHMIWHEGWHSALIMLALRLNGEEPTEEWEELNLWAAWRDAEI